MTYKDTAVDANKMLRPKITFLQPFVICSSIIWLNQALLCLFGGFFIMENSKEWTALLEIDIDM